MSKITNINSVFLIDFIYLLILFFISALFYKSLFIYDQHISFTIHKLYQKMTALGIHMYEYNRTYFDLMRNNSLETDLNA